MFTMVFWLLPGTINIQRSMTAAIMNLTVQRKIIAILTIIRESHTPIGARLIAGRMSLRGYDIEERAVRYYLHILDEQGFTKRIGYGGRIITERGMDELNNALVGDRVGFIITKIERLMLDTTFDLRTWQGYVIINMSIIDKNDFDKTMGILEHVILMVIPSVRISS